MFELNIRFQIASMLFLFVILFSYLRTNKLPILSTKYFSLFIFSATVNLFADITTVYTITHLDTVPNWVNRMAHQVFILSLNCCIIGLFLYVSTLGKNQKRYSVSGMLLRLIPFFISIVITLFGPLYYLNNGKMAYSYGPMAITVYASIAIYLSMILFNTFYYKEELPAKTRRSVRIAIAVWVVFASIQFIFPWLLISGMGCITMVLFLYLSFENPKEHIDQDIGCFNKRAFQLILSDAVNAGKPFYIVNIIVEDLAEINKHFGHNVGNVLLEKVVTSMSAFRYSRIYRSHTNSLTWIVYGNGSEAFTYAEFVYNLFSQSFQIDNFNITAKAHVDILQYPRFAKTEDEIRNILNHMAEQVNIEQFIRCVNQDYVQSMERIITIENMLRTAIETDGFTIRYQPIYSVHQNRFASAEALVRLKDTTTLGYVPPDEFVAIAERQGLISELGAIVFEKVCKFLKSNQLGLLGVSYIEINLSGIQCMDNNLPNQLHTIMKKYEIDPQCINLEITETASVESGELLHTNMEKLRSIGCSFSMDDFGTGYSNLSQMADLSYDLVKIDKSLLWRCFENNNEKAVILLKNVITMLMSLNIKIVAEGVETKEQADWLSKLGVDYLQGYFYSKPIEENEYISFLTQLEMPTS